MATTFRARGVELCREILGLARGANCRALRVWISKRGGVRVTAADTADWDLRGSNRRGAMAMRGWPHLLRYRLSGYDGIEIAGTCVGRCQSEKRCRIGMVTSAREPAMSIDADTWLHSGSP